MTNGDYVATAPTLLIGLGGLGSSIVQEVYEGLDEETRKSTRAHVLDTDVADLTDERFAAFRNLKWQTQTSRNATVQECVRDLELERTVSNWFPSDSGSGIMHKLMTKGAAQIRAISRLAWVDTLNSERIGDFDRNILGLFRIKADGVKEPARVLIVNSIAGGTGTGLFLQIALYIRKFCAMKGISGLTIRGFAVMPDVFINNGDYASEELRMNVQANAYAVIKEIDALIRLRAGAFEERSRQQQAPFYETALEYIPGQRNPQTVETGDPPFNVVTLFDYTGRQGENLGSKFNYIAQVKDAIRLHLFSPLAGRGGPDSQEDNLANTLMKTGDRGRYAGCGTARVEYPFEDIVEYGAMRWATDGISASWMEIDQLINEEILEVQRARREGLERELPDPHVRFGEHLRTKGDGPKPSGFYKRVYDDTQLLDDKGAAVAAKHELWLTALERKVKGAVEEAVGEKKGELSQISMEALRDRDNVVSQVEQSEDGLKRFAKAVEKRVQPLGISLAKEAIWRPFEARVDVVQGDETQLNTWLLAREKPMHPLAMRYFLVEARTWLSSRLKSLKHQLKSVTDSVEGYDRAWDDLATDEVVESASAIARARRDRWYSALTGDLRRFAEDYWSVSETQRSNIERRAELFALTETFDLVLGQVEELADTWREWFLSLSQVRQSAADRIASLERQHDWSGDTTRLYVHASGPIKRKLWEQQSARLAGIEFPPEISREMYLALYRDMGEEVCNGIPVQRSAGWVQALFDSSVLDWCRRELRSSADFDMDVSTAIRREWVLNRELGLGQATASEQEAFVSYLRRLEALATPWIDSGGRGELFNYLCMHPAVVEGWSDKLLNEHAAIRKVHRGFSRHVVSRMTVVQVLCATDLQSVVGPESPYRAAYDERIRRARAQPPLAVTPHLDFRWDSPAFLPELDDEGQARAIQDVYRAALLTLADTLDGKATPVFPMSLDLRKVWAWSPVRGVEEALRDKDQQITFANSHRLVDVLAANYWLVRKIVTAADDPASWHGTPVESTALVKRLGELVDAVSRVASESADTVAGPRRQRTLLQTLFDEVYAVHYRAIGMPDTARQAAGKVLERVWNESEALKTEPRSEFAGMVKRAIAQTLEPQAG